MRLDQPRFAEDKGVFDHILKFPDIARVVIGDQAGKGFPGQSGDLLFLQHIEMVDEMMEKIFTGIKPWSFLFKPYFK